MDRLPTREWIRAEDAAEYLKVGRATICRYIKARILVGRQPKRRGTIYVSTASIRRLLEMPEVSLSNDESIR
jgi:predicted DNA-binding transcriptional regulator AlpA